MRFGSRGVGKKEAGRSCVVQVPPGSRLENKKNTLFISLHKTIPPRLARTPGDMPE